MAQNFNEAPAGSAFTANRDIFNNALAALRSSFSGTSAPPSPVAGQPWYNTTTGAWSLYNGSTFTVLLNTDGDGTFVDLTATGDVALGTNSGNAHPVNGLMTFNDGFAREVVLTVSPGAVIGTNNYTFNGIGIQANAAQSVRRGIIPLHGTEGSVFKRAQLRWQTGANTPAATITINLLSITLGTSTTVPTTVATITDTATVATSEYRTIDFNPSDVTFAADTAYFLEIATTPGASTNAVLNTLQIEMTVRN
jgi:hypothetical protein